MKPERLESPATRTSGEREEKTRKGAQRVWGLHIIGEKTITEKEILLSLIKHLCSKYLQKVLGDQLLLGGTDTIPHISHSRFCSS